MLARNISYYIQRGGVWIELHSHNVVEGSVIPRKGEVICGLLSADADTEFEVTKVRYNVFDSYVEVELAQLLS